MEGSKWPASMRTWNSASLVLEGTIRLPGAAEAVNLEAAFLLILNLVIALSIALDIFVLTADLWIMISSTTKYPMCELYMIRTQSMTTREVERWQ